MSFKNWLFWMVGLVGLIFDQITKYVISHTLELGESIPLWDGVFHFTYVTNKGAAFSLFRESGGWLRWLSLTVSLGLMALAWFGPRMNRWEQLGYGFILAGALGNGIDRFVAGEVIDFLDVRLINFAIFNIADVFINIGIVCLLISAFAKPEKNGGS